MIERIWHLLFKDFLLDPYTYQYLNSSFQRNKDKPINYVGDYSTDILASKVYGFLDDASKGTKPFFLVAAPNAPHSNVGWDSTSSDGNGTIRDGFFKFGAPVSAERHRDLFPNEVVPRTKHFNPEKVCRILISKLRTRFADLI
jgi:Sulfatase